MHIAPALLLLSSIGFTQDANPVAGSPNAASSSLSGSLAATGGFPNSTIFTNLPGLPSADVPGLPGAHFGPGTGTTHFDRVYGSPNGNWVLSADTDLPTTEDEILMVNGVTVARQGTQAPWAPVGELTDLIDTKLAINDAGEFVAAINTTGDTNFDEYIVKSDSGGGWVALAQEAMDAGLASLPGTTWDDPLESPVIDAGGTTGWAADLVDGGTVTTATDQLLVFGGNLLMQQGVTVPAGQVGAEFVENFDLSLFFVSSDGLHWLVQGDLTGSTSTDDVLIVDGNVVLQEDSVIPGSVFLEPIDLSGIVGSFMDAGGNWYARGNNDTTETDWVVRNGIVVAQTGQSVDGSSAEVWDDVVFSDCFFLHTGNSLGDYVIGGVTDNPDPLRDGLLVLNGNKELVRQGDPIDLDNNGVFDDDAYFDTFGNDDGYLSDSGDFYIVATIMDITGTRTGQGFFRIATSDLGSNYCVSNVNSTGGAALISADGSASIGANNLVLSAEPIPAGQNGIFFYGPDQIQLAFGNGSRCVGGGAVGLARLAVSQASAGGVLTHALDYNSPPTLATQITAGSVWNFQAWFRDPLAGGAFFDLSDGIEISFLP